MKRILFMLLLSGPVKAWHMEAPDYNAPEYIRVVPKSDMAYECQGSTNEWLGCAYRLPDSFLIVIVAGLPGWLHECVLKHERRHRHEGHPLGERKQIFEFCNE